MTHRTITMIGFSIIFLSGYVLFSIKREVETLNFELSEIQKQVNTEKGNINLLKAEYVYLSSPTRIGQLAKKYLHLSSATPEQIVPDPVTNSSQVAPYAVASKTQLSKENLGVHKASITPSTKSTWRYKHMGSKYVHKASLNKK